eukprot:jgi/Tetstr1/441491/TSEL_029722.t1
MTRDTTTLALLQALALKVNARSTRLDEHDNNKNKEQRDIPSDDDEVGEGGKEPEHDARTTAATGRAPGVTAVATPPSLWRPLNNEADRYLTEANKTASRDEHRHMLLCYGVYCAAANAAAKTAMASLRAPDTPTQDRVDALDLVDTAHRTLEAVGDVDEAGLTYLRRFKAKKALTPEDQVIEQLVYSRVFDTAEHERSANVLDGLLGALEDKRFEAGLAGAAKAQALATFMRQATERDTDRDKALKEKDKAACERREQQRRKADAKNRDNNGDKTGDRPATDGVARRADRCCPDSDYMRHRVRRGWRHWPDIGASAQVTIWIRDGVRVPFRYNRPPPRFNQGVSFNDATPAQLKFPTAELRCFTAAGAWEKSSCAWWVSRAFIIPKPGDNEWRFIVDLRVLSIFCARKRLRKETLMGVRHLTAKGDYMFSLDLQHGFYALGIAPSDRNYFTVNIRGTLYRLCGLPMGWSLSPYYFTTFTMTFVKHLRSPTIPAAPGNVLRSRRWLRRGRWRGARIFPHVDDFLLFASSEPEALELRQRVPDLLDSLGMQRNPTKGLWEPVQYGQHLGVDIDTATGYSYALADKLQPLARQ